MKHEARTAMARRIGGGCLDACYRPGATQRGVVHLRKAAPPDMIQSQHPAAHQGLGLSRRDSAKVPVVAAVCFVLSWAAAPAGDPLILPDQKFYTQGHFIAYAAPWSTFGPKPENPLKSGVDFADAIVVRPDKFPAESEFTWHWPLTPSKTSGVYGCNAISFGSYDGGVPAEPIPPKQVKEIRKLSAAFAFEMAPPLGDFNVLTEFFLTREDAEQKVAEIGFLPRPARSAVEFANSGEQIGIFQDAEKRQWKVAVQGSPAGPYYMFMPAREVLSATVDFRAALDFLSGKGRLTGDEWFRGLGFGVEPISGSGSLRLCRLTVVFE